MLNNFCFQNPTKLIMGKGMIAQLSKEIPSDKKVMITFGGGSVKRNGVYEQVKEALKNHNTVEFWGIEPNRGYRTGKSRKSRFPSGCWWRLCNRRNKTHLCRSAL